MTDQPSHGPPLPGGGDRSLLTHRQMLGGRLYVQTLVRLMVAGAIALLARLGEGDLLDPRAGGFLQVLALVIAAYDLAAFVLLRRYRLPEHSAEANALLQNTMWALVGLDYFALTAFVWVTGGSGSPLLPFYVTHAVLSQMLLSPRRGLTCVALAFVLVTALVVVEWSGAVPVFQALACPDAPHLDSLRSVLVVVAANAMLLGLTSFFVLDLSTRLRNREVQLHGVIAEATRLSELRKDFLRIAMHNLQSPIGAMTMQLENLRAGRNGPLTEPQVESVRRCLARVQGLSRFLKDLQMLALLDNKAIAAQHADVDIGPMLVALVEEYQDVAEARGVQLTADLPGQVPMVRGVERLLREAVVNFVTNAIKFTPGGGHVHVRAERHGDLLRIAVEDDGIGIAPEDQARLFQEFVRLGRQDPKTGSGLGLSIARRVAEAHGGRTRVWSEKGVGSIFTIELPVAAPAVQVAGPA
ncbi:MAG: HAMP domain-containing histidine kinase [Planctomycetes bacterium]|nr:HAMP domain-containing histidine kinase [Planctomycetota bacterium]